MEFSDIRVAIEDHVNGEYVFQEGRDSDKELLNITDKNVKFKDIIRIKRRGREVNTCKTIVAIEISLLDSKDYRNILRFAISWLASVKETLTGTESSDLYLFLAIDGNVSQEECLRIESTEQICRKYVLLPGEELPSFLNRTFLQSDSNSTVNMQLVDPVNKAFFETSKTYKWLTPELQSKWKKALLTLSGDELVNFIVRDEN